MSSYKPSDVFPVIKRIIDFIRQIIVGDPQPIFVITATLLAEGHVLITGPIGSGKTTLARSVAKAIGGTFSRVQMSNETLPSDLLGFVVYTREGIANIVKGSIFANVVLLDDINNAPPRTLSALLQAMQEGKVSLDGNVLELPKPHLIIATMNTTEAELGFMPELSLVFLDRFMSNVQTMYVGKYEEKQVIKNSYMIEDMLTTSKLVSPVSLSELLMAMSAVREVYVDDAITDYLLNLVYEIRRDNRVMVPISTRGVISLYRLSQAYALINGRSYVVPDDIKAMAYPALSHRIVIKPEFRDVIRPADVIRDAINRVPVPR
ncbi:ATPase associated with various cellular activities AAA_3 [Vulcanisaeta moutnovskia 768-28]|uniref:ATPase associated with various cellular activities AAA_3 n=1 Tax=Vulcanisaeta moutnovskia (strain 768-28) TaxID=985053 RepID=F0QXS9_VULM7|nr:MoxR family ATPase [Vulcanisaeta moutnovskia]ADY01242.1 ATPase associated with various cellular activities AAA_3 [Vulcanisaeta moutnovskia 768-28]